MKESKNDFAVRYITIAYAGKQRRFSRNSQIPDIAVWQVYELLKEGMTPEEVEYASRFRYPTDFSHTGAASLLPLIIQKAHEIYINSGHIVEYKSSESSLDQSKN